MSSDQMIEGLSRIIRSFSCLYSSRILTFVLLPASTRTVYHLAPTSSLPNKCDDYEYSTSFSGNRTWVGLSRFALLVGRRCPCFRRSRQGTRCYSTPVLRYRTQYCPEVVRSYRYTKAVRCSVQEQQYSSVQ